MDARTVICKGSQTARTTAMRTMDTETQTQTKAEALDRRFVFHPFTKLDEHPSSDAPVIVSGQGSTLTDSRGRTFLDAMAGLWCVNVGYGRREIADALRDEALRLGYYHAFSSMATDLPAELAERVLGHVPGADVEDLLRQQRLRRERHAGQARLVLQQRPRAPREEEDHLARPGLPRRHDRVGEPHRPQVAPRRLRPAAADGPAHEGARTASGSARPARATRRSRSGSRTSSSS